MCRKSLLLATRNKNKKMELEQILADIDIDIITLDNIEPIPEIIEDGNTFTENAIKKAVMTSKYTGYDCLADDSGLVVDALGGQPGIYSARFAGEDADDEKNNKKLLQMLHNVEEPKRTARFVCVIAVCTAAGKVDTVQGSCDGMIARKPAGTQGFGYDPLFIPAGYNISFAELAPAEKNAISHRGKALFKCRDLLREMLNR